MKGYCNAVKTLSDIPQSYRRGASFYGTGGRGDYVKGKEIRTKKTPKP